METLHSPLTSLSVRSLAILPPFNRVNSLRSRPSLLLCRLSLAINDHHVVTPMSDSHKIHNWILHCPGHLFAAKPPSSSIAPLLSCSEGLAFPGHIWPHPFPQPPNPAVKFYQISVSTNLSCPILHSHHSYTSAQKLTFLSSHFCNSLLSEPLLTFSPALRPSSPFYPRLPGTPFWTSSDHVTPMLYTFSKSPSGHTLSTHLSCLSYLRGSKVDHIPDTFPHNF